MGKHLARLTVSHMSNGHTLIVSILKRHNTYYPPNFPLSSISIELLDHMIWLLIGHIM